MTRSPHVAPNTRRAALIAVVGPLALVCALGLGAPDALAAPAGDQPPRVAEARTDPALLRRVLPRRCGATEDEGRPCADLAESVDRWFDGVAGGGLPGAAGSGTLAFVVSTDALLMSTTLGQDLELHVGGTGPLLSWHVGAGLLHTYDRGAYGFSLGGAVGLRVPRYSPWSVVLGAKFLNLTDFYDDGPDNPAHHILGELGASFDLPVSRHLMMRFGLSALLGVERRSVARFEGAREVLDEETGFSGGAALRIAMWLR